MKITRFEDLECWQEARNLVNGVYRVCRVIELKKDYSLADQVKRAATSIMANIAEGFQEKETRNSSNFFSYLNHQLQNSNRISM
jgi:four helix bundle protein